MEKPKNIDNAVKSYMYMLFDQGDNICVAPDLYTTQIFKLEDFLNRDISQDLTQFISINSFKPDTSRADKNVEKFRTFLIEIDNMTIEEQQAFIEEKKMPHTCAVFSGNKSIHFLIVLEHPLANAYEYMMTALRLHKALDNKVDKTTKNPSRFTRFARGINKKTGKLQEIQYIQGRIKNEVFFKWLDSQGSKVIELFKNQENTAKIEDLPPEFRGRLSKHTLDFIKNGATKGERNHSLYRAAADMAQNNYTQTQAEELLGSSITIDYDFTAREFINTIASAYKRTEVKPRL